MYMYTQSEMMVGSQARLAGPNENEGTHTSWKYWPSGSQYRDAAMGRAFAQDVVPIIEENGDRVGRQQG